MKVRKYGHEPAQTSSQAKRIGNRPTLFLELFRRTDRRKPINRLQTPLLEISLSLWIEPQTRCCCAGMILPYRYYPSRWKNQKKGNGVLHRYRLPTPAKVHSLLARNNLFTRIVNCAPAIQWSLWLSYQGHSPNSFSHATLCRIEVFIPRQGFHSISPNGFGEAYLIEKRQEFLILLQPFFDRHRTLTSG